MAESGFPKPLPGQWWAIAAPKGTPPAILQRINAELGEIMKAPEVQEKYAALGISTAHSSPEHVVEMMKLGARQMGAIVKAAGIQPEWAPPG